jgi:hypothetical protein
MISTSLPEVVADTAGTRNLQKALQAELTGANLGTLRVPSTVSLRIMTKTALEICS